MRCLGPHDSKAIKVDHAMVAGAPVTYVLYRCARCGDVRSEELDGTWLLSDIWGSLG